MKDISAICHGAALKRPYYRCGVTGKGIISGEMAGEWSVKEIKEIRSHFLEALMTSAGNVDAEYEVGKEKEAYRLEQLFRKNSQ